MIKMEYIYDKSQIDELTRSDKPDLELKNLDKFIGTMAYYNVLGVNVTDGVKYIMENGYSWFVTDSIIEVIYDRRLRSQPFLTIKLIVNKDKNTAMVTFEDGNDNVLKRKYYSFTDAKRDLTLFLVDNVLMLNSEY